MKKQFLLISLFSLYICSFNIFGRFKQIQEENKKILNEENRLIEQILLEQTKKTIEPQQNVQNNFTSTETNSQTKTASFFRPILKKFRNLFRRKNKKTGKNNQQYPKIQKNKKNKSFGKKNKRRHKKRDL